MKLKFWIFLIYTLGLTGAVHAQTANCSQQLSDAQARFDLGNLPGIPEMLTDCINSNGFTPEERTRAHKLMTLVYLYQDNQAKAEEWIVKLLRVDKEHQLDPVTDPADIFHLYEKFRSKPIFRVKPYIGGNLSRPASWTPYGIEDTSGASFDSYKSSMALFYGLEAEKEFYKGLAVSIGFQSTSRSWFVENATVNYTFDETQVSYEVPIGLKYTYYRSAGLSPFATLGGAVSYLTSDGIAEAQRLSDEGAVTVGSVDMIEEGLRNRLNTFVYAGLGAKYRIKTNFLVLEAKYMLSTTNYSSNDNTFQSSSGLLMDLGYIDDTFTINSWMFSVGWQQSIYKPKKIKE